MRVGQVAQIVGISARSIRHYHRLGVIAEPARTASGYREYDVADLARIARIAFLSDSGVPLKEIAALLEPEADDPGTDLAAIRDGIDERMTALTRQRDPLDAIAQRAVAGLSPGLLPEPVARALDLCRSKASGDPDLAALVDLEPDMLDLAALRGDLPDYFAAAYSALATNEDRRRKYLDLLAGFHRIKGRRPADVEPEITRLAESLITDPTIRSVITGAPADMDDSLTRPHARAAPARPSPARGPAPHATTATAWRAVCESHMVGLPSEDLWKRNVNRKCVVQYLDHLLYRLLRDPEGCHYRHLQD